MYNKEWLYNLYVRQQADEALYEGAIDEEAHKAIYRAKPAPFYTPNIFVRIGMGIAVFIMALFGLGFISLVFLTSDGGEHVEQVFGVLVLLLAGSCLFIGVQMIQNRHDYNSGRDNMLLWLAGLGTFAGIVLITHGDASYPVAYSLLAMLIAGTLAFVFIDMLMSVLAFLALLSLIYLVCGKAGAVGQGIASFAIMGVSGVVYYLLTPAERLRPLFRNCFYYVRLVALLTLYAAGNYYIVCKAATGFSGYTEATITGGLGIFFWVCTFGIPLVYLAIGIRKRELMLMRAGALLLVAGVLTFRQYHSVLPAEIALSVGGIICIVIAYWLLNYLENGRAGFTAQKGFAGYDKKAIELLLEDRLLNNKDENRHDAMHR
jgi:hypothetical protein